MRQHLRARDSPSRSRSRRRGPRDRPADGWRAGPSRRRPGPSEKMPGWLSHVPSPTGCSAGEAAPVVGRLALALGQPEDAAMELRQRAVEAERLADLLLQAGRAVVVGRRRRPACRRARATPRRARCWRSSLPCAWSAAPGRAARRRSRCAARPTSRLCFRRRYSGRNDCSASMSRNGADPRRAGRTPAGGERSGFEGVGEGAAGLAHGTRDGASHDQALAQLLQRGVGLVELALDDRAPASPCRR